MFNLDDTYSFLDTFLQQIRSGKEDHKASKVM